VNLNYTRGKSRLELIGISDPARDQYLPRINDKHRMLVDWDEQAIGGYFTNSPSKNTDFSAYYFLKKEVRDCRPANNPQFQPDRHINTAGAHASHRWGKGWNGTGEFALQWGADHAGREIHASGGYGYLKKSYDRKMKPYVLGGYWYMSGDDPGTSNRDEGFDPLFSRWPKWSELYIYSQFREKGVGYWTNLSMLQAEAAFAPWKKANWRFTYYHMDALQPFTTGSAAIFGTGTRRGEQFQTRLDVTFSPSWRAHALYEYHLPGKFYRVGDAGYFVRFEVMYTFKHQFAI
jgi:hypothetical protein